MHKNTRLGSMLIATMLAGVLAIVPGAARAVHAAEDFLRLEAAATFRVDTRARVVRARIDFDATNLRPNVVRRGSLGITTTRYYFDRITFAVPFEARSVRATSGGRTLSTSVRARGDRYREVTVRMPNLYYRSSRSIRVDFLLPGGKPRSASEVRVGAAFATFTAWAWGDANRSSVRVVMPRGFTEDGFGEDVVRRTYSNRVEFTASSIDRPEAWYRVIVGERPSALTDLRIEADGHPIIVKAWPEDTVWRDQVAESLEKGLPLLEEKIGLPWPVTGDLEVTEVHTPLLHGYAGFYDPSSDDITVSEDLDDQTILHEAAHAWFNGGLVRGRWITEGLADYYADRARVELGLSDVAKPTPTKRTAPGAFPLNAWPNPSRIDDEDVEAQETFGYAASYTVILELIEDVGEERMREVLRAMDAHQNPYRGDGPPEVTGLTMDWRSFLDAAQEIGRSDTADELFRAWVMAPGERGLLDTRDRARAAYADLDEAGDGWAVPVGVRSRMALWRFAEARALIDAAEPVVALRDDLADATEALGLAAPADVEQPFEAALDADDLDAVASTIGVRIDASQAVADARDALAAERTPLARLGLVGESPDAGYVAARASFEKGDVAGATAASAATVALLAGAESVGTTRAAAIAAVVIGIVLLVLLVTYLLRRRRARAAPLAVSASTTLPATPDREGARPEVPSPSIEIAPGAEPD